MYYNARCEIRSMRFLPHPPREIKWRRGRIGKAAISTAAWLLMLGRAASNIGTQGGIKRQNLYDLPERWSEFVKVFAPFIQRATQKKEKYHRGKREDSLHRERKRAGKNNVRCFFLLLQFVVSRVFLWVEIWRMNKNAFSRFPSAKERKEWVTTDKCGFRIILYEKILWNPNLGLNLLIYSSWWLAFLLDRRNMEIEAVIWFGK